MDKKQEATDAWWGTSETGGHWYDGSAARSGRGPKPETRHWETPPGGDFISFMTGLAAFAYVALGLGKSREIDLEEARQVIDTIGMLAEKTKGNLTKEEESALERILFDLRMSYAKVAEGKKGV